MYGFLDPERLDLYRDHPARDQLDALRREHGLHAPDELWVVTTEGSQTRQSLDHLLDWWRLLGTPLPLRVWTAAGTDQLADQAECDRIRELTLRVVLRASDRVRSGATAGQLVLSLAGGRKTMSADLQWAGGLFGAAAWLHVVGPEPLPEALRRPTPERLARPLPAELARAVTPLVVGSGTRDELLDLEIDGRTVSSARFPVPEADMLCRWTLPEQGAELTGELRSRLRQGSQLFGNFLAGLARDEHHENWRSLYRLPPAAIDRLRTQRLGRADDDDRAWLTALPKADLHRHLGGCLDLPAQRAVGRAIWTTLTPPQRAAAQGRVADLLRGQAAWDWDWPQSLHGPERAHAVAALLVEADDALLTHNLWQVTEPRVALKRRDPRGFAAYERPGELSGSALLSHPAALAPYAGALAAQAAREGLAYIELRGSPHKYRPEDPAGFLADLRDALRGAGANTSTEAPQVRFIWILDRRQRHTMQQTVLQAVRARETVGPFLVGLDLAGDEGTSRPEELAAWFEPAFRTCLPLTIHAGEGEQAENIWEAAYRLHADRIGHGLSLSDDPALLARFRDRGIALELCPSSNREVVGFQDPAHAESADCPRYPLRELMAEGLPLTLATDNPGISRTTLAGEYLAASRMASVPLTLWEALALVKQGFTRAFLPASERERLVKRIDVEIYRLLA